MTSLKQKIIGHLLVILMVNEALRVYREWILEFTKNYSIHLLDFYEHFIDDQYNIQLVNYCDGIHPTVTGNEIMSNLVVRKFIRDFSDFDNI